MTEFDDFFEASSLHAASARSFAARVAGYAQESNPTMHRFDGSATPIPLRPVGDRTHRMLAARRSVRTFSKRPFSERDVNHILAAVGPTGDGRRLVPEAGGIDAVFAFAIATNVAGRFGGRMLRYDHLHHAVADVGPCPSDADLRDLFLLGDDDVPQFIVVFVIDDREVRAKYGERAGRFVLQQVGHATQNIGLRLAADGNHGYILGGGQDVPILRALGLAHTGARYGGAIACGR